VLQSRRVYQSSRRRFFYSPGVTEPYATRPSPPLSALTLRIRAPGQVVRRLLRQRNIVIDAETA
jgi:hypothetical protein